MEYIQLVRRGEAGEGFSQAAEAAVSWVTDNAMLVALVALGVVLAYFAWRGLTRA